MGSSGGEFELLKQLDSLAKQTGWRKFALPTVQRARPQQIRALMTMKGWPDRVYFRKGRIIVIETKPETGRDTTPEQDIWLEEWGAVALASDSVKVFLVRPSGFDEIAVWFA